MNPEQIQSLIRSVATFFGGYLTAKWALPPDVVEAIIGGLAAIAAAAWGIATKRQFNSMTPDTPPPSVPPPTP